jgi:hypothetical protein
MADVSTPHETTENEDSTRATTSSPQTLEDTDVVEDVNPSIDSRSDPSPPLTNKPDTKPTVITTRSRRRINKPVYLEDYITSNSTLVESHIADTSTSFIDSVYPLALMLTGNQDNFYYHKILREPDT